MIEKNTNIPFDDRMEDLNKSLELTSDCLDYFLDIQEVKDLAESEANRNAGGGWV